MGPTYQAAGSSRAGHVASPGYARLQAAAYGTATVPSLVNRLEEQSTGKQEIRYGKEHGGHSVGHSAQRYAT